MNKLPRFCKDFWIDLRLEDWLIGVADQHGENWIWMAKKTVTSGFRATLFMGTFLQAVLGNRWRSKSLMKLTLQVLRLVAFTSTFALQRSVASHTVGTICSPWETGLRKCTWERKTWLQSDQSHLNRPLFSDAPIPHLSPFSTKTILALICPKLLVFTFNFFI